MPIPPFDGILDVLPPHLGDPRKPSDLSPNPCTVQELCGTFATSAARKRILEGFLRLRAEMFAQGVRGFQWIDGSFLENIEAEKSRDPNDVDVVTFVDQPARPVDLLARLGSVPAILNPTQGKVVYLVDHYLIPLGSAPVAIVEMTRYWYGLFSHRRDGVWKGMLRVEMADKADDDAARIALGTVP